MNDTPAAGAQTCIFSCLVQSPEGRDLMFLPHRGAAFLIFTLDVPEWRPGRLPPGQRVDCDSPIC